MKRLLAALLAAFLFIASAPIPSTDGMDPTAFDWAPRVAMRSMQSIVRVESSRSVCTGFVIDDKEDLILTAKHCITPFQMFVDGEEATVVLMSTDEENLDLAVLKTYTNKEAILPGYAAENEPIFSIGFGYGFPVTQIRTGYVLQQFAKIAFDGHDFGDGFLILSFPMAGGMSGGPTINQAGEVVGMNQMTGPEVSAARNSVVIVNWLANHRARIWRK